MSIFVIDFNKVPLLPTSEARARILLKRRKAKVFSVVPFTIQFNREVSNPIGEFKIGIDDGAKKAGISVAYNNNVIFAGTIKLRQDVSRKMLQRAQYRRSRRSRNLRHRPARFLNRGVKGWIPPTIKQKKDSILRVIDDLKKRINITKCVVEQGQFDISSMSKGYKLTGMEYQLSEYEGNNWRQKVLWRDKYKCQHCDSDEKLQAHHIIPKSKGGTNVVKNGITLCEKCHDQLHKGYWSLDIKPKMFKYPTHLQQGKWYLFSELKKKFNFVKICYGWMTAKARMNLGLGKDHHFDASAMLGASNYKCNSCLIIPRRTKVWENNPSKTCTEKNGFKHFDIVKAKHRRLGIIIGSVRSLKEKAITIRTSFDDNFPVSYSKTKLLWRPSGLIYCRI
jgi:uncharacterized protein YlxP (DUF503 family)